MIALGGNSLSRNGQTGTIQQQFEYTRDALNGISHFIEQIIGVFIPLPIQTFGFFIVAAFVSAQYFIKQEFIRLERK